MLDDRIDQIFGDDELMVADNTIDPTSPAPGQQNASPADSEPAAATADADQTPATSEAEAEAEAAPDAQQPNPAAPVAAAKTKQVAFKLGDKEVPLDETATFNWRVDGKQETITLKDLIQNYAGKIPIERKNQEIATERKKLADESVQFENLRQRHGKLIGDMHRKVVEGKTFEAVHDLIEMSGAKVDARQFMKELRSGLIEQAKQLATMSPQDLAAYEAKEENEYLRSKYERLTQQQAQEQAQRVYQERVAKVVQNVGSTLQEFVEQKSELEKAMKARGMSTDGLTPESIGEHIRNVRDYTTARDAMAEVDPELVKNGKLWDHAVYLLRQNPDWTKDDLRDVLKQAAAAKRSAAVSQKVAKAPIATVAAAAAKAKAAPATNKQKQREQLLRQQPEGYGEYTAEDAEW